ncbi:MAG: hypothetical protein L3J96_04035, partial [Thermoplasmata archaeon]|nr:hypothetical protein [Thermoplasmata archaeon]
VTPTAPASRFVSNDAGSARAYRLFIVYLAGLIASYLAFLVLAFTAPQPGTREDLVVLGGLSVAAVILIGWGWVITVGRAPRGIRFEGKELIVLERWGRPKRFESPPLLELRVVYRYTPGFLGREPTELVEVTSLDGRKRAYLVRRGLLSEA